MSTIIATSYSCNDSYNWLLFNASSTLLVFSVDGSDCVVFCVAILNDYKHLYVPVDTYVMKC